VASVFAKLAPAVGVSMPYKKIKLLGISTFYLQSQHFFNLPAAVLNTLPVLQNISVLLLNSV
jgi:hypothetical protein